MDQGPRDEFMHNCVYHQPANATHARVPLHHYGVHTSFTLYFFRLPFSTLSAWFSHLHCLHYIFPGANNRLHKLFLIPFRQGACVLSLHPQHSITQTKRGVRERLPALRQNRPCWIVSFKPTLYVFCSFCCLAKNILSQPYQSFIELPFPYKDLPS